jgi:hypothetical protein
MTKAAQPTPQRSLDGDCCAWRSCIQGARLGVASTPVRWRKDVG